MHSAMCAPYFSFLFVGECSMALSPGCTRIFPNRNSLLSKFTFLCFYSFYQIQSDAEPDRKGYVAPKSKK